jgi:fatty acid-binding protein DegV
LGDREPPAAHAWFSVDDLGYLKKGGRLSGAAAAIGTIST